MTIPVIVPSNILIKSKVQIYVHKHFIEGKDTWIDRYMDRSIHGYIDTWIDR